MDINLSVNPKKILRFLVIVISSLCLISLVTETMRILVGQHSFLLTAIAKLFDVNGERNIPSFYSALGLFSCSALCAAISSIRKIGKGRYITQWAILSFLFAFLAWDEAVQLHESIPDNFSEGILKSLGLHATGIFRLSWVMVAIPLVSLLALAYLKFFLSLPLREKRLLIIATFCFLSGAVGMEMVSGVILDHYGYESIAYVIENTVEEFLEMLGVAIYIYTFLGYLCLLVGVIKIDFTNSINKKDMLSVERKMS